MKYLRLQLFEFEDFAWYPDFIRKSQTDFLRFMMHTFDVFKAAMPVFTEALTASGNLPIVDLCSGGGGSMLMVREHLRLRGIPFKALLTDLYPNVEAYGHLQEISQGEINFLPQPLDARKVPAELKGFRTIFNGFHHFTPEDGQAILADTVAQKQPIGIFEPIDKSVWQLFVNVVPLLIIMLLVAPFVKPFRRERLLFVYLIPLIPICTIWDGIASVIRLYRPQELHDLAKKADPNGEFVWKSGKASHQFGKVIYLVGLPKSV